jgi:hypothetical protein
MLLFRNFLENRSIERRCVISPITNCYRNIFGTNKLHTAALQMCAKAQLVFMQNAGICVRF